MVVALVVCLLALGMRRFVDMFRFFRERDGCRLCGGVYWEDW